MAGDVRFKSQPQPPAYGAGAARKRRSRLMLLAGLGIGGSVLLIGGAAVAWKYERAILRVLHRTPLPPPVAAPVVEFYSYKTLNDFKGVECIYTAKFVEALPIVNESAPLNLVPMSRVVVQEVRREIGDYDHPTSSGYKLYVKTQNANAYPTLDTSVAPVHVLDTLVVIYPVVGNRNEVIELHLCPVSAYKKAQELWLDRSFKYVGNQIGGMEIDPGTIVTVTGVVPDHFGTSGVSFDLTFRLPGGETVHQSINPGNMGLLQAADQ